MFQLVILLFYLFTGNTLCGADSPRFIPVFEDEVEDCGHSGFIEWSELEINPFNDTHVFLDGEKRRIISLGT